VPVHGEESPFKTTVHDLQHQFKPTKNIHLKIVAGIMRLSTWCTAGKFVLLLDGSGDHKLFTARKK